MNPMNDKALIAICTAILLQGREDFSGYDISDAVDDAIKIIRQSQTRSGETRCGRFEERLKAAVKV